MKNKSSSAAGVIMLAFAALLWGIAFVAQSEGMDHIGPIAFNGIRMFIGGILLIPAIMFLDKIGVCHKPKDKKERKKLLVSGVLCGVILSAASLFQQMGLTYTTPGKAAFITTLYIVIIPLYSLVLRKVPHWSAWPCVALASVGLYLLCIKGSLELNRGDIYVIICAFIYALHVMSLDVIAKECDPVRVSSVQFITVGIICGVLAIFTEGIPTWDVIYEARVSILYTAICSSAIAFTLQAVAQSKVNPITCGLVMSLESVFGALASWVILKQTMSAQELIGCGLIFTAIIISNLLGSKNDKPDGNENGKDVKEKIA